MALGAWEMKKTYTLQEVEEKEGREKGGRSEGGRSEGGREGGRGGEVREGGSTCIQEATEERRGGKRQ